MIGAMPVSAPAQESGFVLLTVPEACGQLRISRWMLYRLIQTRQLETIKLGNRRLVPVDAVTALIRSQRTGMEDR